jgi:hypothetical protein
VSRRAGVQPRELVKRDLKAVRAVEHERHEAAFEKRHALEQVARRVAALAERLERRRERIEAYVREHGRVEFPGIGKAYLSTVPAHAVITDAAALPEHVRKPFEKLQPVLDRKRTSSSTRRAEQRSTA